jgi:hypothetical protein
VVDNIDGPTRLTFRFSYQHAHFEDEDSMDRLIRYIDSFLADDEAAIEFFDGDDRKFGGSVTLTEIDLFSIEDAASHFGYSVNIFKYHTIPNLKNGSLTFKVRTWSGKQDLDAVVEDRDGFVVIVRI